MADSEKKDLYEILGIDKGADDETIKKAYRSMAKKAYWYCQSYLLVL